jgi:hypothetical protein
MERDEWRKVDEECRYGWREINGERSMERGRWMKRVYMDEERIDSEKWMERGDRWREADVERLMERVG